MNGVFPKHLIQNLSGYELLNNKTSLIETHILVVDTTILLSHNKQRELTGPTDAQP